MGGDRRGDPVCRTDVIRHLVAPVVWATWAMSPGHPVLPTSHPRTSTGFSTPVNVVTSLQRVNCHSALQALGLTGLALNSTREVRDLVVQAAPLSHQRANFAVCVHDCGVVPVAEMLANLGQ